MVSEGCREKGLVRPDTLGIPPSPQRAAQAARKRGPSAPEVLAS